MSVHDAAAVTIVESHSDDVGSNVVGTDVGAKVLEGTAVTVGAAEGLPEGGKVGIGVMVGMRVGAIVVGAIVGQPLPTVTPLTVHGSSNSTRQESSSVELTSSHHTQ